MIRAEDSSLSVINKTVQQSLKNTDGSDGVAFERKTTAVTPVWRRGIGVPIWTYYILISTVLRTLDNCDGSGAFLRL